ncbi:MAG TPA: GH25 family lysozyme [Rhizobiaceae bacterium]|nr:GH25 family lysozyme [Rhizobiaceae bacterium]
MRSRIVPFLFLAALIAGCSSTPDVAGALRIPPPSHEKTASIAKPSIPLAPIVSVAAAPRRLPVEKPMALAEEKETQSEEAMALMIPPTPTTRPRISRPRKIVEGRIYRTKFRDSDPVDFGRHSPRRMEVHGVDVSRWQGNIDWGQLRDQGANFAYIKATDGGDHVDPMFMRNWRGAEEAGLKRGAYHFFYWCRPASEQADWFIRNVPNDPDALPPVIDVEWNHMSSCKRHPSRDVVLEKMQVFMDRLERHYGKRPVIYTTPDFYYDNLRGAFRGYGFWLRSTADIPARVYPDRKWLFWQYSGSGKSHGVEGPIDLNVFNGDEGDWWRWSGGAQLVADAD